MKLAVVGYGKMGRAIEQEAERRGHEVRVRIASAGDPGWDALADVDAALEFTAPDAAMDNVSRLLEAGLAVVCGTTGWQPGGRVRSALESDGALILAPNFSVGVQLFFRLAQQAAETLGAAGLHEPYIWECHHRAKVDAPSGTARRLASLVAESDPRGLSVLEGHPDGALPERTLQVVSVRAGDEPGTHRLAYDGPHELIHLEHRARSRSGFAAGAVLAAEWLRGRRGRFAFEDVVDDLLQSAGRTEEV